MSRPLGIKTAKPNDNKSKVCHKCLNKKDKSNFTTNKKSPDGLRHECNQCRMQKFKNEYHKDVNKSRLKSREARKKLPYTYIWAMNTKNHHRYRGYTVEMSFADLEEKAKKTPNCDFCEKPLEWNKGVEGRKVYSKRSPTLENINCEKVINKVNSFILCRECNTTKMDRTLSEFFDYCEFIIQRKEKILGRIKINGGS